MFVYISTYPRLTTNGKTQLVTERPLRRLRDALDPVRDNPVADFNSFSHAGSLASSAEYFVAMNNDTVYSIEWKRL